MPNRRMIAAAAVTAALAGGGVAGALLGVPGISGAQTDGTTETAPDQANPDHPPKGGRFDLAAAATALGVTEDELKAALEDGQSIADVAAARGVDVQTVIDALVASATARIDEKVAAGDLTAEEAAEIKADLAERITDAVNRDGGPRRGGPGHGPGRGVDLSVAAQALGVTDDELRTALESGQSIADVAAARGVDVQTVIDALVADATQKLEEAKAELPERITDMVNRQGLPDHGPGGPGGRGGPGGPGGPPGDAPEDAPADAPADQTSA